MAREIKFKAWLPAIKKMTYSHTLDELMNWKTDPKNNGTAEWLEYTGLQDIDGKEIFEGDIVDVSRYAYEEPIEDYFGQLIMSDKGLVLVGVNSYGDAFTEFVCNLYDCYKTEITVRGNIYENPELLKEGDIIESHKN